METRINYNTVSTDQLLRQICGDAQKPALRFRPITPDVLPLINSLLQTCLSRTCDYTVGGIFMWVKITGSCLVRAI